MAWRSLVGHRAPASAGARGGACVRVRLTPQHDGPELTDILGEHRDRFGPLALHQLRAVQDIMSCRTGILGGHVRGCDACGHQEIRYNSCRNRHCPKCQGLEQARWLDRQEAAILPVEYHHVVFTVPDILNTLFRRDPGTAYRLLFAAASETLLEVAAEPANLGACIGFTAVLHTWSQTLLLHPHIHCIVPGGGLDPERRWRSCPSRFFLPVAVLAKVFKGKLLRKFESAFGPAPGCPNVKGILVAAARKDWVVFSKPPVAGASHVLSYLARYTQRTAISNSRIVGLRDGRVTFRYRDSADHDRRKLMTLDVAEFIRRFLLHVLPKGLMRVRHYGLLANVNRKTLIPLCQALLGHQPPPPAPEDEGWEAGLLRLTGKDVTRCPRCNHGTVSVLLKFDSAPRRRDAWVILGRATFP